MKHLIHISAVAALCTLSACSSSDCTDNRTTMPLAGFRSSSEFPQEIFIDTLWIAGIGAPSDSVLSVFNASQAYLPFDNEAHSTSYVFRYNHMPAALYDTISFDYDIAPRFESAECGVVYQYKVREIKHTTHFIDSISCPTGLIDNTAAQNIFIYFRLDGEPLPSVNK